MHARGKNQEIRVNTRLFPRYPKYTDEMIAVFALFLCVSIVSLQ